MPVKGLQKPSTHITFPLPDAVPNAIRARMETQLKSLADDQVNLVLEN